ncbi:PREDICTED: pancreatic lipase-related protein 2-like [Cyphomyrmex costatus]|uniref:pancreatic lipase-related protein 2-like n=1 Tax=Cyphomyrmex costatus TaxID=456900 RepID=UPI0008522DE1|nr:PREDICTED: pancreatic lipase-related protein 2-like [Cyphomyrmex costatus]
MYIGTVNGCFPATTQCLIKPLKNITMSLIVTFLVFLFLNVSFNIAELLHNRPSIQNFQDHSEGLLEVFLNPTSIVANNKPTIGDIIDLDFKVEDIKYELYTKDNKEQPIYLRVGDAIQLKDSPFNPELLTKIIIHGWTENGNAFWLHDIRRNYLNVEDYNVICVDWFAGSTKEYLTSVKLTHQVGEYVAAFIEFLGSETQVSFDDIHVVGHSLGAHVAGYIGNYISKKLGRITGLDPAGPAFETPYLKDTKDRLDAADANFVDVIHTCAGSLGFLKPIGHADFYPNGGTFRQPGCPVFSSQTCSHGRSYQFFAESIVHPDGFVAVKCSNWMDFQLDKCSDNNFSTAVMGEFIDSNVQGIFYLQTNAQAPFGKGKMK